MNGTPAYDLPVLPIDHDRTWWVLLGVLAALALMVRLIVWSDWSTGPMPHTAPPGSPGWFAVQVARQVAATGDWTLVNVPPIPRGPELTAGLKAEQLERATAGRLPRGAPLYTLMGISVRLGWALLPGLLLMLAGALVAPLVAIAGAWWWNDRRAGLVAGLLAGGHQSLVLASVLPGPWGLEALAAAWIAAAAGWVLRRRDSAAGWAMLSLGVAAGLLLRPLFGMGALLVLALLATGWRAVHPAAVVAAVLPMTLMGGVLAWRCDAAGGPKAPAAGLPAWTWMGHTMPAARLAPALPADLAPFAESNGRLPRLVRAALRDGDWRAGIAPVLGRKLRAALGARDEPGPAFNPSYLRLKMETLRTATLAPDTAMALAWAAALFLLIRRRLGWGVAAAGAVLVANLVLFDETGPERHLLHLWGCLVAGVALVEAADRLRAGARGEAMALVMLWAGMHAALAIDDHARGSRYRDGDFEASRAWYAATGDKERADAEAELLRRIRRRELLTRDYWSINR
jgi:hypothetical protein